QTPGIPREDDDTILVWQGDRALIFLRTTEGVRQLCFNFDLATSNAPRIPAFIVLLHRFVADLREQKIIVEAENFEINQPLSVAYATGEEIPTELTKTETTVFLAQNSSGTETIPLARARLMRAPDKPGFFEIRQGNETPGLLLQAAAHFADTREADLRLAATRSDLDGVEGSLVQQHTERDANWPLWLLILLAVLLASWYYINRPAPTVPSHP
ncbi:MAG: hypothetical protein KDN20_25870, partial [Verrucomicrobiae bacterium]|nr:hypothetical protein [Verrucomicrobiae bacterium]